MSLPATVEHFPHGERALAASLGLGHSTLRAFRKEHLAKGSGWELVNGQVGYSNAGREAAYTVLKISRADTPPPAAPPPAGAPAEAQGGTSDAAKTGVEKNLPGAPAAEPGDPAAPRVLPPLELGEVRELICAKKYARNLKIVEAKLKVPIDTTVHGLHFTATEEIVLVRVRDSRNLMVGMVMKCRFTGSRVWELAQRLPRWRGKW